jgi:acyl carrier protein
MLTDKFINVTRTFLEKFNDRYHTDYKYNIVYSDTSINPSNEWGFDSLDMVEYIMDLETAYKIEISDEMAIELKTIGELCDFCETKSNGK